MAGVGWALLVACGGEKAEGTGSPPEIDDTAGKGAACSPLELTLRQELLPPDLPRGDLDAAEHGTALGDLDGDGDLDVLLAWEGGSTVLQNDGTGQLTRDDRWTVDGLPLPPASSAALADLDGDGDLDGWLGRSHGGVDLILMQAAPGQFTAIALPGTETGSWSGVFVDLDGDLDLDLVIGSRPKVLEPAEFLTGEVRGEPNHLVFQDADGWRVTDGPNPPDEGDGITFQLLAIDADLDGDIDLYEANDGGWQVVPNRLWVNDGWGNFTRDRDCGCELARYAMGAAATDLNGDRIPDLYISDIGPQLFLLSDPEGGWVDATLARGAAIEPTADHMVSWGVGFRDLDRDGFDDLWVCFGGLEDDMNRLLGTLPGTDAEWARAREKQVNVLLMATAEEGFEAADLPALREVPGRGRTVAFGDLDGDGDDDVVTTGKHFVRVWEVSGGCDTGLRVVVDGPPENAHGMGTRITVRSGGHDQTQWLLPGRLHGQDALDLHFGLGGGAVADWVQVRFPDGSTVEQRDVPAGALNLRWRP